MAEEVDLDYLKRISGDDETFIDEMVNLFIDTTPEIVLKIKNLYRRRDFVDLYAVIHKFSPNLTYVGLFETQKLIRQISQSAQNGVDYSDMEQTLDIVIDNCLCAVEYLKIKVNPVINDKL